MSENNNVIHKTVVTMAELTEDEKIRQQCLRREKYERDMISATNYGIRLGISEGGEKMLINKICKKLQKGKSPSEIADALEEDPDKITHICSVAAAFAPEYDCDSIYRKLQEHSIQ